MTAAAVTDRRGVALMLVLWILVTLAAVSSGVVAGTRGVTGVAANYRARVVARYAAESGVTLAVATLEDGLAAAAAPDERADYLNHLGRALDMRSSVDLGDARLAVSLVDPGARLDVNAADARSLARLFSFFTTPIEAERAADAVRTYVGGADPDAGAPDAVPLQALRPLRTVDELYRVPGMPSALARRASALLTVDGDGTVNRATASDTVLAAAAGQLRDEPSRILVISRGWKDGHPLTHEIEAAYAVAGSELTLIGWRERDR